jgi:hypothetical protein
VRVMFPDGTRVTASALCDRSRPHEVHDYGLYMDRAWDPPWSADWIDWPDFGVPSDSARASALIRAAFERARSGKDIQIGCVGGLGRTGTVLACMAILAGVPARSAVTWVRAHYTSDAIETKEQEDWIARFAAD